MAKPLAPGIHEHPLTIGLDAQAAISDDVGVEPLKVEQLAPILARHLAREIELVLKHLPLELAADASARVLAVLSDVAAQAKGSSHLAEQRLRRVLPALARLEVFVLESHDFAAAKLLRGNEHDREQLRDLHELHPLSLEFLTERNVQLLADYVGDPSEPRWSFVHFVEAVWCVLAGVEARRLLGLPNAS